MNICLSEVKNDESKGEVVRLLSQVPRHKDAVIA
jgi:hypothetical protein